MFIQSQKKKVSLFIKLDLEALGYGWTLDPT